MVAALVLAAPAATAQTPARRAITHEDLWTMPRVGAPSVSPDGKWVVVSVLEPAYDDKQQVSDLWIVAADGSSPARRLTSTPGAEGGAAWSKDSVLLRRGPHVAGPVAGSAHV